MNRNEQMEEEMEYCDKCEGETDELYIHGTHLELCEKCHFDYVCGFCGNELDDDIRYCSKECSVADNTEGV